MQRAHHGLYQKLYWEITAVEEIKAGLMCIEFDFSALNKASESVRFLGIEYILIREGIIGHIEVA